VDGCHLKGRLLYRLPLIYSTNVAQDNRGGEHARQDRPHPPQRHRLRRCAANWRAGELLTPAEQTQRDRLTGIALMCATLLLFAGNDATAKYLNGYMDSIQVVWVRYMSALALAIVMMNPVKHPGLMRTGRPWLQLGRSTLLVFSTTLNFIGLRYLQLDQSMTIMFCTPFIVALLGGPLLGEWVGWRRWIAITIGFCGVLLVARPGAGGIHPAALLILVSALSYALYSISTRVLARTDSDQTTNFYSNLVGAAAASLAVPFVWAPQSNPKVIVLMCTMGLFGGFGHYLLIRAHRLAPAAVLAPFIYSEIIWMIALGFLIFGDVPNHWTLAGVVVVILSGLYLLYRERVIGPRKSPLD
jgi:drug/metabolite transporter (DMT)-like permease